MEQYLKIKYILLMTLFIPSVYIKAQISEGGVPPSFQSIAKLRTSLEIPNHTVSVNLDVERLIWEDSIAESNHAAIRVAEVFPVSVNIDSTGVWTTLSATQKIWQQTVTAPGADGLIISYKEFYIPEGAKLFIYNNDKSQILGAYTHTTNEGGGSFATEIIHGDSFTLEYVSSGTSSDKPRLELLDVGYVYDRGALARAAADTNLNYSNNSSNSCIPNINCYPENNKWKDQKRGIVLLLIKKKGTDRNPSGWYGCSGSLVNNTKEPGKPYVLTASHCLVGTDFKATEGNYEASIFYFNYEEFGCSFSGSQPSAFQSMSESDVEAFIPLLQGSDAALLLLRSSIPDSYKVYYNGWDWSNKIPVNGAVIHHPDRDVKKIAKYESSGANPSVNIANVAIDGVQCASNAQFKVNYKEGVTQGGSSGSALFNENGLIVGTLSGGSSACSSPLSPDYFGRFHFHWDKYQSDETNPPQARTLKQFLDPDGNNQGYLAGYDPNPSSGNDEVIDNSVDFILFPNPANNEININAKSLIKSVRIFDIAGRLLYSQKNYSASTLSVNISGWSSGVYSVAVQTSEGKVSDKFIKK